MNILVAFGSTEGHTRKVAHNVTYNLKKTGHNVELFDCNSLESMPDIAIFDAIIVAGSVHQEEHQSSVVNFVKNNLKVLSEIPSCFISVSLSASLPEARPEAEKYVSKFAEETGWKPQHVHLAGGAIRFLEYDFFKRFTIQYMVLKGKEMPDESAGNPEYTDWEALNDFVTSFVEKAGNEVQVC